MSVRMFKPNTLIDVYCLPKMQEVTLHVLKTKQTPLLPTPKAPYTNANSYANKGMTYPPKALPAPPNIRKSAYNTMRVKAYVGKQTVHSLIDFGSTHTFLDLRVAKRTFAASLAGFAGYETQFLVCKDDLNGFGEMEGIILDRHFKIKTDHFSLKYLIGQRLTTPFQAKWLPKLLGYDYEISYKKGSENTIADALSRISSAPFEIVYGQAPSLHLPYIAGTSLVEKVDRTIQAREQAIAMLQFHLKRSQERMKNMVDKHRIDRNFEVGMKVYLKLHHKFPAKFMDHSLSLLKLEKLPTNVKRLMGSGFNDSKVHEDIKSWPFKVIEVSEGKPLLVFEHVSQEIFSLQDISALILKSLKKTDEAYLGTKVTDAVIVEL
ncbi:retrotransposable element Tf2 [Tanacetum coccineum]